MKIGTLTTTIFLVIILSMTGVAVADGVGGGCPGRGSLGSHTTTYDNVYAHSSNTEGTTIVTYLLNTIDNDASIIGYCVYPEPGFTGDTGDINVLYPEWAIFRPGSSDYFGFQRGTGDNNIPIDDAIDTPIGEVNYKDLDKLPTRDTILLHIDDPEECIEGEPDDGDDNPNTCFRRSGTPSPPVSEIATIGLVGAGLIGLVALRRKK